MKFSTVASSPTSSHFYEIVSMDSDSSTMEDLDCPFSRFLLQRLLDNLLDLDLESRFGYLLKTGLRTTSAIIFVDAGIDNLQGFLAGIIPGIEVVVLDSTRDGIKQITALLYKFEDVKRLHIVSHGSSVCINLGSTRLHTGNLGLYYEMFKQWSKRMSEKSLLRPHRHLIPMKESCFQTH